MDPLKALTSLDGRYQNATGSVRLSGAVNLSELGDGVITFDCLFVINLD